MEQKPHAPVSRYSPESDVIDFGQYRADRALDSALEKLGLDRDEVVVEVEDETIALGGDVVLDLTESPKRDFGLIDFDEGASLEQRYYKPAPRFSNQALDSSREMPFRYKVGNDKYGVTTEHEGLLELWNGLHHFIDITTQPKRVGSYTEEDVINLRSEANSILESLTFIGYEEYQEAVEGIGEQWKKYLDEDPDRQLCIVAGVTGLDRYQQYTDDGKKHFRKSDDWLREDVLLTFSDEEIEKYKNRILFEPTQLTSQPDKAKVVLLDDWSISGRQLREAYKSLAEDERLREYISADRVEVNLITASEDRLRDGLRTEGGPLEKNTIPVRSYFKSHEATCPNAPENHAHVSGLHSSVNYGFRDSIRLMLKIVDMLDGRGKKHEKSFLPILHVDPIYTDSRMKALFTHEDAEIVRRRYNGEEVVSHG